MPAYRTLREECDALQQRRARLESARSAAYRLPRGSYQNECLAAVQDQHNSYEKAVKSFNLRATEYNRRLAAENAHFREQARQGAARVEAELQASRRRKALAATRERKAEEEMAATLKARSVRREMEAKTDQLIAACREAGLPHEADKLTVMKCARGGLVKLHKYHQRVQQMLGDTPLRELARKAIRIALDAGYPVEAMRIASAAREARYGEEDQFLNTVELALKSVLPGVNLRQ